MRISSPRLRRLDNALADFPADSDAMMLSELDGYIAGLILCPEPILLDEWLPVVWGEDGVPYQDTRDVEWLTSLVIEHHDAIVRALSRGPDRYLPFFEEDARHHEILWELWIEGFATAMGLRPEAWVRIAESGDEAAAEALGGLVLLAQIASDESDLERPEIDTLTEAAPGLIPGYVDRLNAWRSEHVGAPSVAIPRLNAAKPGRNDPCPCGSGRKFKKCCGLK